MFWSLSLSSWLLFLSTASYMYPFFSCVWAGSTPPEFYSRNAKPRGNLKDLRFVSRIMVPYGPNLFGDPPLQTDPQERPWRGYGYGMGAGEEMAFDTHQKFAYVASSVGFVTIVDYQDPRQPVLTDYAIGGQQQKQEDEDEEVELELELEEINDLAVCPQRGWLFLSIASRGVVAVYKTVQRSEPADPELLLEIPIQGGVPSNLLPNSNCTLLCVSNENAGGVAFGTVTLLRDLDKIEQGVQPTQTNIPMDKASSTADAWDDEYVLGKGLHMPLTKNALEYWDEHSPIADQTNFTEVRNNYRSSLFLEGEFLAWASPDENELLVNLQINNGLLRIDVRTNRALALAGYGLKDHQQIPIDIDSNDKSCNLKTYPNLFALRSPDSIRTLRYNDKLYVLTANEGDDKEFQEYSDIMTASDLFVDNTFGLPNVRLPVGKSEHGALFNGNCQGDGCVGSVELSVGSTAIDYELDPANPTFHRMVLVGGRGWSIYELPEDPDALLKLVFDSGDDMERSACEQFPWAYNAAVDEDFAPTDQMPNHTLWNWDEELRETLMETNDPNQDGCIDQGDGTPGACPMEQMTDVESEGSGAQIEHVEAGVACGRLFAVVASEKNSIAWLYDITNIASPDLIKTFHLSPEIQKKSPGLAYNDGTIGEIDPENFLFLSPEESPTGKAAILFGGAFSGTLSLYEFECGDYTDGDEDQAEDGVADSSSSSIGSPTRRGSMWSCVTTAVCWAIMTHALMV